MSQRLYSQTEIDEGLPQYHQAIREKTGYTGQFKSDPAQTFQQYMTSANAPAGAQAAANQLAEQFAAGQFRLQNQSPDTQQPAPTTTPTTYRDCSLLSKVRSPA